MLIPVADTDLMQMARCEYNLYAISGILLLAAGEPIQDEHRTLFSSQFIYRQEHELPKMEFFDHEGHVFRFEAGLTSDEQQELQQEASTDCLLEAPITNTILGPITHFLNRLEKGATPDIALCEVVRDKLIAEVTCKVDQIQYLSQIRMRDEFTYSHILDVTALSITLALKLGLSKQEIEEVALAAILHDLGKLLIPRDIMFKPGRLSEKEFQVMQLHPELGYKIIKDVLKLPDPIALPALEHQEMYGGGGYPQNIRGEAIHPYSHIVKIADVYDALTSKRPYKESIPSSKAMKIMLSEGEKSFHPEFLAKFVELSNYRDASHYNFEKILERAS